LHKISIKSTFVKNVLTLMTGTTIAQAIPLLISPLLTRLYTPENFGLLAIYMSLLSVVTVFATGRYELAIVLPKIKINAIHLIILSIYITVFVSFFAFILVYFFSENISTMLHNTEITYWLWWIPISILSIGIFQSLNYWCIKNKKFKKIAHAKIIQSLIYATVTIAVGFGGFGASGLILGLILSQVAMAIYLLQDNILHILLGIKTANSSKIFSLAKEYKKMPLLNLPNAFFDNVRLSGINILIGNFYSNAVLGQFSLAWRMVQAPFAILGGSISQVFFQKLTETPPGELTNTIYKILYKLFLIAIIPFTLIFFYSENIFGFVFGSNWVIAGQIASVLSPWLFVNFLTSPIASVFIILNKQEIMLYFSIIYMIIPLSILYFLRDMEILHILSIINFSMAFLLIIFILLVLVYAKKYDKLSIQGDA